MPYLIIDNVHLLAYSF